MSDAHDGNDKRDTPPGYRRPSRLSLQPARDTDPSPAPVFDAEAERDTLIGKVNRLQDSVEGLRASQDHAFQRLRDGMRRDRLVMTVNTFGLASLLLVVLALLLRITVSLG